MCSQHPIQEGEKKPYSRLAFTVSRLYTEFSRIILPLACCRLRWNPREAALSRGRWQIGGSTEQNVRHVTLQILLAKLRTNDGPNFSALRTPLMPSTAADARFSELIFSARPAARPPAGNKRTNASPFGLTTVVNETSSLTDAAVSH